MKFINIKKNYLLEIIENCVKIHWLEEYPVHS